METLNAIVFFVILLNVCILDSQIVQSPCRYFEYRTDENGDKYGLVKIDLDGPISGVSTFINFTIPARISTKYPGSIEYLGLRDSAVTYRVHFPLKFPTPTITQLVANNNILCETQGDLLLYISSYGLSHQVTFGSNDLAHGFDRPPITGVITFADNIFNTTSSSQDTPIWNPEYDITSPRVEPNEALVPSDSLVPPRQPVTKRPVTVSSPQETLSIPRQSVTEKPLPVQPVPTSLLLPPRPSYAMPSTNSAECGIVPNAPNALALVFQGDAFEPGEWPWLVAIYLTNGGSVQYICAGSLVSDMHVITAAHCMQLRTLNSHKHIVVRAGVHNLDNWGDENSVTRTLASARIHESYSARNLANDILVLTCMKRIEFTPYIRPICLWEGNYDQEKVVGKYGVVAGWGDSENRRSGRGEPRMVRLKIVDTNTCRKSNAYFEMLTSSYTLCAGERNGAGPCFGDTGAGMYLREGGRWKLRGIVSLSLPKADGEYNCNLEEYLVFTDAAQYSPWITDKMISN